MDDERTRPLPLKPLLGAYVAAGPPELEALPRLPGLGPRLRAVLAAQDEFLNEAFLAGASAEEFDAALGRFYEACTPYGLYRAALHRRAAFLRHAVAHLRQGRGPLAARLGRCLAGPYRAAGPGPSF